MAFLAVAPSLEAAAAGIAASGAATSKESITMVFIAEILSHIRSVTAMLHYDDILVSFLRRDNCSSMTRCAANREMGLGGSRIRPVCYPAP